jgi:signal transduction histidine kinase
MRSELAAPFLFEGRVLGVLNLESERVAAFSDDDRRFVSQLANDAAIAIHNAERYAQLEIAYAQLETANRELQETRDRMSASQAVAWLGIQGADWKHTINQKIFSISNYTNGLRRQLARLEAPDEVRSAVERALTRIEEVSNRIRDVDFTSYAPDRTTASVPVDTTVRELVEGWVRDQPVTAIYHLGCDGVRAALAKQWFKVALEKLVKNALRAMPDGGELTVTTQRAGEHIHILVKDTGPGLPGTVKPYFLKQAIPPTENRQGSGMGALIARFVALAHDGELTVAWSGPDQGTALLLQLPIAGEQKAASVSEVREGWREQTPAAT